jgi:hypothetical protein
MYQNFRGGTGLAALGQGIQQGLEIANNIKQRKMQEEQFALQQQAAQRQQTAFDSEQADLQRKRRSGLYQSLGETAGGLFSMNDPQARQAEYAKWRDGQISAGMANPNELPESFEAAQPMANFYYQKHQQAQQKEAMDRKVQEAQIKKLQSEASKMNAEASGKSGSADMKLTEGQKTFDREFAKDHNEWTSGGANTARSEINKLQNVIGGLKNGSVTTGGLTGAFPDRMTSESVLRARADVQSTVMNSLRAILGAQFTEKEGERIIKNTWNEADSTENNVARLERLVGDLSAKADAKDAKGSYFERMGGSLYGFQGGRSGVAQTPPRQPGRGAGAGGGWGMSEAQAGTRQTFKTNQIEWAD